MRTIKFRAWDKDADYMSFPENIPNGTKSDNGIYIFMQFTGLLDKNGKEIYEGDILKYDGETRVVIYEAPSFELQLKETRAFAWDNWAEFGEVIGNIHENPELLKMV
mgnify:CR=1 FL=1